MSEDRLKLVLRWAMNNRAEDSFEERFYYWTPEAKKLLNKLTLFGGELGDSLLIGVIGPSGAGKSALARALRFKMEEWCLTKEWYKQRQFMNDEEKFEFLGTRFLLLKWMPSKEFTHRIYYRGELPMQKADSYSSTHSVFMETADYGHKDIRLINRDLNNLHNLWSAVRSDRWNNTVNFVIFLQKELIENLDHFFLRKMDKVKLGLLTTQELLEAFKLRFESYDPFNEDAIMLIAELSRGVFRRFMRYIQLVIEDVIMKGANQITVENVKAVITQDVLMQDMELEFFDIFKNKRYKEYAVKVLQFLRENKTVNQKTLAEELGVHATILGRILATLEENEYIKRTRGREHGELIVSLR